MAIYNLYNFIVVLIYYIIYNNKNNKILKQYILELLTKHLSCIRH